MLAREIVCVIRSQGGRFLKKSGNSNSTAYEDIGDHKAEAKTAQALREGLDVRATNAAASNLLFPKSSSGGKKLLSPRRRSGAASSRRQGKNIIYSSIHPAVAGPVCFVPHVGPSLPMLSPTSTANAAPVHCAPRRMGNVDNADNAPATPVKRTRFEDDCGENAVSAGGDGSAFVPPLSPATKRMRAEQQQQEEQCGGAADECEYDYRDDYPQYHHHPQQNYYHHPPQQSQQQQYHHQGGYYYGAHQQQPAQQQPRFTPGQFEYWSPRSWDQEEDHGDDEEDDIQAV